MTDFVLVLLFTIRITGAFIAAPIFGNKALPVLVKLFLSLFIAYLLFLTVDTSQIQIELSLWFLVVSAIKEIITGLILGFMLNFVFYGVLYAGAFIGFDVGLSFANIFDPAEGLSGNAIGEILYFTTLLVFLLINGHQYLIEGLTYSFLVIPIGSSVLSQSLSDLLINYSAQVFVIALKIAAPIIVSFFLVNIAEGIISRVIPQMQVFFVTQPLKIGLGFLMLASLAPIYIYAMENLLRSYENQLVELIRAMR